MSTFYDWGDSAVDLGGGLYRLTKYDTDAEGAVVRALESTLRRARLGFDPRREQFGDVRVRRGGAAPSVGHTGAASATGGNQRGITGGAFFFFACRGPASKPTCR